ncbi:hypothetical protein L7F22_010630 [Adiantum nelumboides]|nr:hypothetical protein [Adiantum nelumboides]
MAVLLPSTSSLFILLAILALWRLVVCRYLRYRRSQLIARLDPVKDCHAINSYTLFVEFPFLYRLGTQLEMFRNVGIPVIARLLKKGGFMTGNLSKRFDDADILIREMLLHHVDSPRGSLAIRRLNLLHSYYRIDNDEYLYLLSLRVLGVIELSARYGYREWTEREKCSHYTVWHDIAVRMGIRNIPASLAELARFRDEYEAQHMVYHPDNQVMADSGMQLLLDQIPFKLVSPLVIKIALSLIDNRALTAVGYPIQPKYLVFLCQSILKLHGAVVRWMPPRPLLWTQTRIPLSCPYSDLHRALPLSYHCFRPYTYKQGYKIAEIGGIKHGKLGNLCEGDILCPLQDDNPHARAAS